MRLINLTEILSIINSGFGEHQKEKVKQKDAMSA